MSRLYHAVLGACLLILGVESHYPGPPHFTTCYDLPNPVFGKVDYPNGRQYFAYARYQCASGYTLDDVRGVLCDHDGRWLSYYGNTKKVQYNVNKSCILDPSATPKELPVISNGYWTLAGNRSRAQIHCYNGYTLPIGDGVARLENREWKFSSGISSAYRQCVVVCPALYHIDHGVIHTTGSRFENSAAQISCLEEFTFTGRDATVICLANGSWTTPSGYCTVVKVIRTFSPTTSSLINGTLSPTTDSNNTIPDFNCIDTVPTASGTTADDCSSVGIIAGVVGAVVLLSVAVVLLLFVFHRKRKKDKVERTSSPTARNASSVMTENEAYGLTPTASISNSGQVLTPSLLSAAQAGIPLYSNIPEQDPDVMATPVYEDVCHHVERIQPCEELPLP